MLVELMICGHARIYCAHCDDVFGHLNYNEVYEAINRHLSSHNN